MREWDKLVNDIMNCRKCGLYRYRKKPVPGEGKLDADIMFIGEAPGAQEDLQGRPFVGPAGKLLTQLLESIGLKREEVYITNIVKCRPPNNRDPEDDEIKACTPYLIKQIQLVKPKIIVALGRYAGRFLFNNAGLKWKNMNTLHGKAYDVVLFGIKIKLLATYHPAAALYYPKLKPKLEKDFMILKSLYEEIILNKKEKKHTLFDYLTK